MRGSDTSGSILNFLLAKLHKICLIPMIANQLPVARASGEFSFDPNGLA